MFRYRCNSHSFKLFRTVPSTTIFKSTENRYNLHSIYKYLQHMCAKLSLDSTWSQQGTKPASFTTIQRNLVGIFLLSRLKYQIRCLYSFRYTQFSSRPLFSIVRIVCNFSLLQKQSTSKCEGSRSIKKAFFSKNELKSQKMSPTSAVLHQKVLSCSPYTS